MSIDLELRLLKKKKNPRQKGSLRVSFVDNAVNALIF